MPNTMLLDRAVIHQRLREIQTELDEIGPTCGMQGRRSELTRLKNELLDKLCELRSAA
jgi:hypothetical protein